MEEDIRKRGTLYLQQQRFGRRWRAVWCAAYGESRCSAARLEVYEAKRGSGVGCSGGADPSDSKRPESKRVIRLRDCIRISGDEAADCPRGCGAFLVETAEKLFVFAAQHCELKDWTMKLCELAFPVNRSEHAVFRQSSLKQRPSRDPPQLEMENSLYEMADSVRGFAVTALWNDAAARCDLHGAYFLTAEPDSLLLKDPVSREVLFTWPYRFVRKFGQDKKTFSFEAGRRCDSGEGNFEFATRHGETLFKIVSAATQHPRGAPSIQPSSGTELDHAAASAAFAMEDNSVYSRVSRAPSDRPTWAAAPGALPKPDPRPKRLIPSFRSLSLSAVKSPRKNLMRNSIERTAAGVRYEDSSDVEHVYDQPEGCRSRAPRETECVYDDPEEVRRSEAIPRCGLADPSGQQCSSDPQAYFTQSIATLRTATVSNAEENQAEGFLTYDNQNQAEGFLTYDNQNQAEGFLTYDNQNQAEGFLTYDNQNQAEGFLTYDTQNQAEGFLTYDNQNQAEGFLTYDNQNQAEGFLTYDNLPII